jgi:hypothetical protein
MPSLVIPAIPPLGAYPRPDPRAVQSMLSPRWRQLVTRDARGLPSPDGQVWASPYRWGCTLVAYHKDRLLR